MGKIICNIPHSGTVIPEWAKKDILIADDELRRLVDFMVDKNIDRLWEFVCPEEKAVAAYSRLVLDVERFRNDAEEEMAKKGMGLYYTHTPDGRQFRLRSASSYEKCLKLYDAYHQMLEGKVAACLKEHDRCLILDCHSFHDAMHYTGFDAKGFPDVCIGINGDGSDAAGLVTEAFQAAGYSVKVNEPFAGALVPLKYLSDSRVDSVMIELNRRIYDSSGFRRVQDICKSIYERLNT